MTENDDEKTVLSRTPAVAPVELDDETRLSTTRAQELDDATRVSPRTAAPADEETRLSSRPRDVDDATRLSRRGQPADDATIVSRGAVDDSTVVADRSAPRVRSRATSPGRISGGRVAFTPSNDPSRYEVRHDAHEVPPVVRTTIASPAPVVPSRQLRDTSAIEAERHNRRRRGGLGLIFALAGSALLVVLVAVVVIYVLFVA